jgi:beta-aspartyl-dipeptidase (metallo-type)
MHFLKNTRILTPDISAARHLLIGGGRILWIGENTENLTAIEELTRESLTGLEVIDLEDRWLLPGLVDCHAHITGGGGESGFSSQVPAPLLGRYTSAGVTSVIGLLGTDDLTRNTSALLARTRALNEEGISAWCYTGGYHLPLTTLTGSARSDIVHIDPIIGVGEFALSDHRSSQPTLDELLRVASEVHVAGLMSGKAGVLHLHMGDGERGLELVRRAIAGSELPARVFHPTHVNRRRELFAEALQLVELGCTIDVTAFPVGENENAWSAADAIRIFLDKGLPLDRLTVSSDGGGCLPVFDADGRISSMDVGDASALLETIRELSSDGLALETILPFFTRNPAALMRLAGKGCVATDYAADLLVLDDDLSLWGVMARGQWQRRNHEQLEHGFFEGEAVCARPK